MSEQKMQPADKLRDGALTLTIWPQAHDGRTFHTGVLSRSYKVGEDWKETSSISGRDMLKAAELLRAGYGRCQELDRTANVSYDAEAPEAPEAGAGAMG